MHALRRLSLQCTHSYRTRFWDKERLVKKAMRWRLQTIFGFIVLIFFDNNIIIVVVFSYMYCFVIFAFWGWEELEVRSGILPCQFLRSLETERTSLALYSSLHTLCACARVCAREGERVRTGRYLWITHHIHAQHTITAFLPITTGMFRRKVAHKCFLWPSHSFPARDLDITFCSLLLLAQQ